MEIKAEERDLWASPAIILFHLISFWGPIPDEHRQVLTLGFFLVRMGKSDTFRSKNFALKSKPMFCHSGHVYGIASDIFFIYFFKFDVKILSPTQI